MAKGEMKISQQTQVQHYPMPMALETFDDFLEFQGNENGKDGTFTINICGCTTKDFFKKITSEHSDFINNKNSLL